MKFFNFLCKVATDSKLSDISDDITESLMVCKRFLLLLKSTFLGKNRVLVSEHVNIVIILSLSLDSLKIF